jgi:hypothetical protein
MFKTNPEALIKETDKAMLGVTANSDNEIRKSN